MPTFTQSWLLVSALCTAVYALDVPVGSTEFWQYLIGILILVILGGILAGLTLGLMSLDSVNLEVLMRSGVEQEREYAAKVAPIRKRGHLLLCTLLLANTGIKKKRKKKVKEGL